MKKMLLPPIVWILSIIVMIALHEFFPIVHIEPESWRTILGIALIVCSLGMTIWHKRLFSNEQTNINTFNEPDKLIESGLFRYIRNPMYLGFTVSLAALAFLGGALSPWFVVIGFFVLSERYYIPYEERAMLEKFGDQYKAYQSRTRRWI